MQDGRLWEGGDAYEAYVGRWSRRIAERFLDGLGHAPGADWLDVGCGTGAVTELVLARTRPRRVDGIDPSPGFVAHARSRIADRRARFLVASGDALPVAPAAYDLVVSGLVVNFIPQPSRGVAEMARVTRPGGAVAAYVWDYADGMEMIRVFWDAAREQDPVAAEVDEAVRFPMCNPDALARMWRDAGLRDVTVRAIEIPTVFRDFEEFWAPFMAANAPAPAYARSLAPSERIDLKARLRARLTEAPDGSISLRARAWAVAGRG